MNCVTNLDAIGLNLMAGAVITVNVAERLSDRRQGISRLERAQRIWLRNQSFMLELGLDPIEVLGLPPGVEREPARPAPVADSVSV